MPDKDDVNLAVDIASLRLRTPLIVASGTFGYGEEYARIQGFDYSPIGAIVLKGTTLHPREGNPVPRLVETACGILNSIGLENPGVDRVVREMLPRVRSLGPKIIANVAGNTQEEYVEVSRRFSQCEGVAALELNISCPNIRKGGREFGCDPRMTSSLIASVRKITKLPLIAKLPPDAGDMLSVARAASEAGADALTISNTIRGMAIDIGRRRPVLPLGTGGLSGPAIKPVALLRVYETFRGLGSTIPIIASGGISNWQDACEFILAGARAFQVGTVLFVNPLACSEITEGLRAFLTRQGVKDIASFVGRLNED